MVATEYMTVQNNLICKTKFGERRVINLLDSNGKKGGAVWATDLSSLSYIKPNQTVRVIRGAKGSLSILEDTPPVSMNRLYQVRIIN